MMNNDPEDSEVQEDSTLSLYFSGWGFDSRGGEEYAREEGDNVLSINAEDGRAFVARIMADYVIFREVEDKDERAAWFLINPYLESDADPRDFDKRWFSQEWKQGKIGRCVIFVAEYMTQYQCAHLLFRPDGTGLAVDTYENPLVKFHWQEITPLSWPELRDADLDDLQPLCKQIFEEQVNPNIDNAYLAPLGMKPEDYVEVPHSFECGSEQELVRLTTAILHSHPDTFEKGRKSVTIKYRAKTRNKRAFMAVMPDWRDEEDVPHIGRLQSLCDLALRLNTFVGETWDIWVETPNRKGDFNKQMHKIFVKVQPPSAHERAESLLILADWLEGKVRPEKRLRLLGLDM